MLASPNSMTADGGSMSIPCAKLAEYKSQLMLLNTSNSNAETPAAGEDSEDSSPSVALPSSLAGTMASPSRTTPRARCPLGPPRGAGNPPRSRQPRGAPRRGWR
ncbi:hypothetical protein SEVIR_2G286301v4 [Setaria viridis]